VKTVHPVPLVSLVSSFQLFYASYITLCPDIPADHEKRPLKTVDSVNYSDYALEIWRADDPHSPTKSYGVFRENEADDIKVLVNNFTAPALASALRERVSHRLSMIIGIAACDTLILCLLVGKYIASSC
jgi:hypothetical protein